VLDLAPAKAPFHFFKEEHKNLDEEELQNKWKSLTLEEKQVWFVDNYIGSAHTLHFF
jgi:hypothetical protein